MPPPVRVTIPLRELVEGLAVTVTTTVVSFVPLVGESEIQTASSLALHGTFVLRWMLVLPAPAPKVKSEGETVSEIVEAAWMTDMLLVSPPPAIVMRPLRWVAWGLAVTETARVALFVPLVAERVIHSALSVIVQLTLETRLIMALPAPELKLRLLWEMVRTGSAACWETIMVLAKPPPVTTISPRRGLVVVLGSTETVNVALFDPEAGDTENHAASRMVVQVAFELIVKVF